jgi:zinc protease
MKRWLSLVFVLTLLISACAPIQPVAEVVSDTTQPAVESGADNQFASDPAVHIGTLDNGLTYYVRHNEEPMNRAELWLVVNAGSVLEDDDQQGLAHFLEHLLFNGTTNFPGSGVVDFLESVGMEFGPDVNAHTSFDETVYTIQVPTDDSGALVGGIQVLSDWAAQATLAPDAIDQERGVIVEEWRLREQTAQGRISDQLYPFILGDSQYSVRLPIGDMDIVRSAPPEAFSRFYHDWYRPDLMAVVAVGDFDADEMIGLIQDHFSDLTAPEQEKVRTTYDLPAHEGTRYLVIGDPEETKTRLVAFTLRPANPIRTVDDLREDVISDLFYLMLNDRLDEIARQPDAPFLSAGSGTSGLVRPVQAAVISAEVQEEKALDAMRALITEIERVRRYGFTDTEKARAEQKLLKFYEQQYNERNNTDSRTFAQDYQDNYLEGEAIPSIDVVYDTVKALIPEITIDEVNEAATLLATNDNRVIYLTGPEKADTPLPTEDELAAVVDSVESLVIEPYVDTVAGSDLMPETPEPAAIVEENELPDIGVTQLVLENGVHVLLKKTDFKDDEIVFNAVSPGGSSLVDDAEFPDASTIDDVVDQSGVGDFTQTDLLKLLAGKTVSVTPYIRELAEGMEGKTTPADLETLFQLVYLYFTAPRADQDAFDVFQTKLRTETVNREQDPNAALSDALNKALYGDTIRRGQLPIEAVDNLDLAKGFEIYKDRFADAGDFTFIFAGNFDEDLIKSYAQTYLGTLPATGRQETWRDVTPELPQGIVEAPVYKGEGERSVVQLVFSGPAEPTRETELELNAVAGVLDIMLREKLREDLGGVYSVGAYGFTSDLPDPSYFLIISFGTDPERVSELVDATFSEIDSLRVNGPSPENLEKVIAQQTSGHQEEMETNAYWSTALKNGSFYGGDRLTVLTPKYDEMISALDADKIHAAAQEFLQTDRYVEAVLYPESYAPDPN